MKPASVDFDVEAVLKLACAYEARTGRKPELLQVPYNWEPPRVPVEFRADRMTTRFFGMAVQFGDRVGVGRRVTQGGTTLEYWQWLD